ncbi:septation ring formation regulator EzrA [Streptococcus pneumoniae]
MSSGLIILTIVIAVLLIVAYITAVLLRKRNETLLTKLEEKKEELYNLPVNDEVERVKNLHLIGQSQIAFREWNQKWVDLSLNSFADIENNLFETETYNNSFRFLKAKHGIDKIESQIGLIEEDIAAIREALKSLEEQEAHNSGRVVHALDLFEKLRTNVANHADSYGVALSEIEKQLENIESEFSQFVTLNSSGDPIEAAEILDKTEDHILALTQIVEKIPAIVVELMTKLPEQVEDLESGYRKLLESDYHFMETDIESRLQQLHMLVSHNRENLAALELDNTQYENEQIQEEIDTLYDIFTREIEAHKKTEKFLKTLPAYLTHMKDNRVNISSELDRLSKVYLIPETLRDHINQLENELVSLDTVVLGAVEDSSDVKQAYSIWAEKLETIQNRLKEIEDEQILLGETLAQIEKDDVNARQKANIYVNKLHTIKRYMEKRNLPGIPKSFLELFFTASNHTEDLVADLERDLVDMADVNRMLDILTNDMRELEDETYRIVQYATLTEQLLQYSNRYRSFDEGVQAAFNRSLEIFEHEFDYQASFEEISQALDIVEPGVSTRFVTSYEKTRETIRF